MNQEKIGLWAALAAARSEAPPVPKRGLNPRFNSRYALLDDIIAAVVPQLTRHGLVVVQPLDRADDGIVVHTDIVCAADGTRERLCSVPLQYTDRRDAQATAALVTYGRRIGLGAGLALALEDDDDANAATPVEPQSTQTMQAAQTTHTTHAQPLPAALSGDAELARPTVDWQIPAGKGKGRQLMSASSPEHLERFAEWLERRLIAGEGNPKYADRDRQQAQLARDWARWFRAHPEAVAAPAAPPPPGPDDDLPF